MKQTTNGQPATYNATAPVLSDGDSSALNVDSSGNLKITTTASATGGYTYAHIVAGQATTLVKTGAGTLQSITFNSPAATNNVTTVYDSITGTGTVIAIPLATGVTVPTTITYNIAFTNGLTIVTATANGSDMTVSFK